jgi:hypothetical protein
MEVVKNSRIGILYKIEGFGLTYIGSTIQRLYERKASHKSHYKSWIKKNKEGGKCASYDILDKGDDWTITTIKTILTDENRKELIKEEQELINEYDCVNKNQAIQSKENLKNYKTEWAKQNRLKKGIEPKKILTEEERRANQAEWMKKKRDSMTQEERDAINAKRREARALKKV